MGLAVDPGTPFLALPAGSEQGLTLHTVVCPSRGCPSLHLHAIEVRAGSERATVTDGEALPFELDVNTGKLGGADERARAWLASEHGAWLAVWVVENAEVLRRRFDRLKGQAENESADTRPAPEWKPTARVLHRQLFPYDFAPTIQHAGKPWAIVDACCPDPACTCEEVQLFFFSLDGESVDVEGVLGDRRPTKANALGKALWNAVHDAPEILDRLGERRDEIRSAGPFVVSTAYEKVRLSRRASLEAPVEIEGGYLQGGAISEALLRRLFEVSERLLTARIAIERAWRSWIHVEIRGALALEAWADVVSDPPSIALFAAPSDELPSLELTIATRDEATMEMRRQRCALGLPLLGGTSLPIVERWSPNGTLGPPSADDVRVAVVVVEALLATPHDEVLAVAGAPRVFEHHVEIDAGKVDVRLTASPAEHPWIEKEDDSDLDVPDDGDLDEPDDGDDVDDHDDDDTFALYADPLVEAFTDAAIDRGIASEVVLTARMLVNAIADFAFEEGTSLFDDRTWVAFLSEHAPRKMMLDEGHIARAPAALRAVVEWLGEVGHVEPRPFRAALDRALVVFQKRARDPRYFSMSKALFTEMRAAGVDLEDQAAIDRFIAVKNAILAPPLPARAGTTAAATPTQAGVTRSPTRWSPAPGERWPAPTDPCGCGSGRRFKKCCMPR